MKKIIAIVLLLVMAFACVACSRNTNGKSAESKLFTYTIVNNTGKEVKDVSLSDNNSTSKTTIAHENNGLAAGSKTTLAVRAVPDGNGNPSLSASYTYNSAEYQNKVTLPAAEIKFTAGGNGSGAFEITAPQK